MQDIILSMYTTHTSVMMAHTHKNMLFTSLKLQKDVSKNRATFLQNPMTKKHLYPTKYLFITVLQKTTFNKPPNHCGEMLLLKSYSMSVKCLRTCYCVVVMKRWRVPCSIVVFKALGSLESDFLVCVGSLFLSSQRLRLAQEGGCV